MKLLRLRILVITGMIMSSAHATNVCPDFYLGTDKDFFNILNNGQYSDQWDQSRADLLTNPRKVVRRDAEYFYAKMPGHALLVQSISNSSRTRHSAFARTLPSTWSPCSEWSKKSQTSTQ